MTYPGGCYAGATGDVLLALNKTMAALEDGNAAAAEAALQETQSLLGVEMPADMHDEG